jgi:hypothetical protein
LVTKKIYHKVKDEISIAIINRKRAFFSSSGGFKLIINGENLNVVQIPMMKFVYNSSDYEFVSVS